MRKNITFIGGDLRIVELLKIISKEYNNISTYALEKASDLEKILNIKKQVSLKEAVKSANIIVAPIPFSIDKQSINSKFSNTVISIDAFINCINKKIVISGNINDNIKKELIKKGSKVIDVMEQESLVVLNTIATAEGAIQVAINETKKTIHSSNVLILGFGRVAKTVAKSFRALSANITCMTRTEEDLAWIKVLGYNGIGKENLKSQINNFDIIINTVPALILNKELLQCVKKDCLIIDLASVPGGVDVEEVKNLNINFNWALGLPSKVAPITAAEHIKQTIDKILEKI